MSIVVHKGSLRDALDGIGYSRVKYKDFACRPWIITFSYANYGKLSTALCELQGSPVKRSILFDLTASFDGGRPIGYAFACVYRGSQKLTEKTPFAKQAVCELIQLAMQKGVES